MNLVAVTDYINNIGGAELSARTIIESLADSAAIDEVTVVGIDLEGEDRLQYGEAIVDAVELPASMRQVPDYAVDLLVERLLARRVATHVESANVVHAHHRRSTLALRHVTTDVPKVGTVRDYWPVCPISVYNVDCEQCTGCEDRLDECVNYQGWTGYKSVAAKPYLLTKRRHYRNGLDHLDTAVYIANHLRETIEADYRGTHPERSNVIYNPISVEAAPERQESQNKLKFVTASTLNHEKGVDIAIEAIAELSDTYPEIELQIFGDGPLEDQLQALAEERCPTGVVSFEGRVGIEEVHRAMQEATATIFPSRWAEPFGRVTVESLMLGTPVVGSNVGGIREIVDDGETGCLFETGDISCLAACLRRVHESEQFIEGVQEWNEHLRPSFEGKVIGEQYAKVFSELQ